MAIFCGFYDGNLKNVLRLAEMKVKKIYFSNLE